MPWLIRGGDTVLPQGGGVKSTGFTVSQTVQPGGQPLQSNVKNYEDFLLFSMLGITRIFYRFV